MKLILRSKRLAFAALCLLCFAASMHSAAAATLIVTNTFDGGPGSLRQAINDANSGDTIVFAASVTGTITLFGGQLLIDKNLTIQGPGAPHLTVSGNAQTRVFHISSAEVMISGLRIADGLTSGTGSLPGGSGIFNNNGRLTLRHCEIANNVRDGGSPFFSPNGLPAQGGGIFHSASGDAVSGGRLVMQHCALFNNRALGGFAPNAADPNNPGGTGGPGQGGALYIADGSANTVTIEDCEFSENSAYGRSGGSGNGTGARGNGGTGQGGGIFVGQNTQAVIQRTIFFQNRTFGAERGSGSNSAPSTAGNAQGAAIYSLGSVAITASAFDTNTAEGGAGVVGTSLVGGAGQGGGLFAASGTVSVMSSTLVGNTAFGGGTGNGSGALCSGRGGGIYVGGASIPFTLSNSTVASNLAIGGQNDNGVLQGFAEGAGIWTTQSLTVTNATIAFNSTSSDGSQSGAGLFIAAGTTTLRNSLLAANNLEGVLQDAAGPVAGASANNLISVGDSLGGISHGTNGNQIGTSGMPIDAKLVAPAFNGGLWATCLLQATSPAINAGNNAFAPARDQRGYGRSGVSDIGAYERDGIKPGAVPFIEAESRRVHGNAGTFDVLLTSTGKVEVESRSGGVAGEHTLVFTFATPLASVHALTVADGVGTVNRSEIGSDPHQLLVTLAMVPDAQYVGVQLGYIQDTLGNATEVLPVTFGVLLGDSNGDQTINSGDAQQTRTRSGQTLNATNFRSDSNVDGNINSGDAIVVRSRSGQSIP